MVQAGIVIMFAAFAGMAFKKEYDVSLADGESYPMHPSTLAFAHVTKWPGRVLCVEVRRDLLANPWTPFSQMTIGDEKCARLAGPFAEAVRAWW